ncbi:YaaA family protein [Salinibacterium sp. NK8237]|uniref:YaaA family protein n=1 Tax=Salinibacterium sp. NK8237 TaxID=2792038 RepID=UPI0018CC8FF2|nr:peroxide stress protein YaaA [Salinibacterium sp. NK8237]MBH0131464.1 peroxide stress protein YaaA [Salinibacterium sp. NK8237]
MIILLPPSETKRDGGDDSAAFDFTKLSFPQLAGERKAVWNAVIHLARDPEGAQRALGISAKQLFEVERNRTLAVAPVVPALQRYTGVLFDGLDAASLSPDEWTFAKKSVLVHSALFGPIGAGDPIPAYRLSHNSKVPGIPLKRHWRAPVSAALASVAGLQLDLRSEAYAQLGAAAPHSVYLRVVTEGADGKRVALSHFNKKSKGQFTRALISAGIDHESADSLVAWANSAGFRLESGADGELDLVVKNA